MNVSMNVDLHIYLSVVCHLLSLNMITNMKFIPVVQAQIVVIWAQPNAEDLEERPEH